MCLWRAAITGSKSDGVGAPHVWSMLARAIPYAGITLATSRPDVNMGRDGHEGDVGSARDKRRLAAQTRRMPHE